MEKLLSVLKQELFEKMDKSDATINSKLDSISVRMDQQDSKIENLANRVETLEREFSSYAEALKSPLPPKT